VVFGAEFLVAERGDEIQAGEHLTQLARIGYFDFQLFAFLISADDGGAFVSQNSKRACLANAQQATVTAERAPRGVEESVRLEDPRFGYAEPGGAQQTAARSGVRERQLDLDLARVTRTAYSFLPMIA
jgi:hypothetical protein